MYSSVRKKMVILICIIVLIMSPSISFAGDTWKKIKNHFKNCEIKIQGATPEQWADILNPKKRVLKANSEGRSTKLTDGQKVLIGIGAAMVAGGIIYVIVKDNVDDSVGNMLSSYDP